MQPRLRFVLVLSALVFALAIGALADESNVRIVRLSYVNGQVQLDRDGNSGLDDAFLNMPLANGAELVTQDDGYAEVEFEAGTTVRLVPNSDLHFRRLGLEDGNKLSVLELMGGTAYFNDRHEGHDEFHVLLNGQDLLVPKSSRFRVVMRQDDAQVSVLSGELRLLGDQELKIRKNQTVSFDFRGQGSPFLSDSIETLAYDSWNEEREGYTGRYVASGSYLGYSSGFSYGWNDINYFGSFFDVPGYGSCWRPYGYDTSWDPYMDGAWVWYPGWGYTWVSGYPWGWAPYRYGRWIWVGGYGWVWQPGHRWNTWYAYAPVYNPPYNYHRQLPPAQPPIVVAHGPGTGIHPAPGGPRAGGPVVAGGGLQNGVIVVGHGPFTGHGASAGGGVGIVRGSGAPGATGGQVGHGRTLPTVITPGVVPNREVVLEQLRRVHGNDLGVRDNVGARGQVMTTGGATTGPVGVQTQTPTQTGATTTVGSTSGEGRAPKQPTVITMPPRPQVGGSGAGNVHDQVEVQPQVQVQPQPQRSNPPPVVMPQQSPHYQPPTQQNTPPPPPQQNTQSSGSRGSHSGWSGGSSSGSTSSGSRGGSSGGSSGGSHSGYSGGSSNSGGSHSSGSSNSSSGHSSGSSQSSGSHDPK